MSNKNTRKVIDGFGLIINYIFGEEGSDDTATLWHELIRYYSTAIRILRKRSDYTDEDIEEFQDNTDEFFSRYVKLCGVEGITNYIHMLGSGHLKYYMKLHRNLYKYSQQGWESLNAKVKQIFFRHTQRGGNYGRETGESERFYLLSIIKAFQRELLWITGDAERYFSNLNL